MASLNVGNLGEFLREQRRNAELSLRQLAEAAGVSNPYLSQIERGLRKPSAEILQQLAKALRISAETLYVQAGILDEREREDLLQVPAAILADSAISDPQKQALLQIYESFRKENERSGGATPSPDAAPGPAPEAAAERPGAAGGPEADTGPRGTARPTATGSARKATGGTGRRGGEKPRTSKKTTGRTSGPAAD
ncbi:helix-turn-helix domain-containing protein [Streptomyces sp. AJS327]|uniref:helix-turn-helix domain-containing protein n=1 Tax=Streptomyces sp. AJS327 TaxID=2545265 RepID=UPI002155C0B1|nr:helix-turn-helix transcriptional regulator [Streptomyces sp. AJS327]